MDTFDPSLFIGGSSDPEKSAEPVEMPEVTPESVTETGGEESPQTEVEPTAEPEVEPTDFADLTPRERMLLDRLERITGERLAQPAQPIAEPTVPATPDAPNFLDGLDMDEVLSTPENFNKLLVAVYNHGLKQSQQNANENMLRSMPDIARQYWQQHATMQQLVDKFYTDNPELVHVKRTVGAVANEVAAEKPELSMDEVFKETSTRVYKMLNIKRGGASQAPKTPAKSGLTTPKGGAPNRTKEPVLDGLAAEIRDLLQIA